MSKKPEGIKMEGGYRPLEEGFQPLQKGYQPQSNTDLAPKPPTGGSNVQQPAGNGSGGDNK